MEGQQSMVLWIMFAAGMMFSVLLIMAWIFIKRDGLSVSGKAGAEKGEAVAAPGRIQCGHGQGPSEPGAAF